MITIPKLPLYFNCFFFDKKDTSNVFHYKIEGTEKKGHPFQLLKQMTDNPAEWKDLSIYASIQDSIGVLLHELFTKALAEEVSHGQASINSDAIIDKIDHGERSIDIYSSTANDAFTVGKDIDYEALIERKLI